MPFLPRIAIVGGGPAGLTAGLLLHRRRIPFTIFELRQKPTKDELAKPSGMLDLHEESGLAVIKECGICDDFKPLVGECTEDFIVAERSGKVLHAINGGGSRPEISRNNLTSLLLGKIPTENIKWDHKLLSVAAASKGAETVLDFGIHGKHKFDLVIGADGAWSKVRKLLTNVTPYYSKTHNITITIRNVSKNYPHLAKLVGSGSFSSLGNRHVVVSQRGPIDSSRVYLWLTIPDEDFASTSGLAGKPATDAKDLLLGDDALLGTFGAPIKDLVATACNEESLDNPDASLDIKPLYALPYGGSWEHKAGVTLIGDAAHLMLPNGEGVNSAMFDSLLLSKAIIQAYDKAGEDVDSFQSIFDPLLKEFEADLVERAKAVGDETQVLLEKMFGSDDAGYDFAGFLKSMSEPPPEQ